MISNGRKIMFFSHGNDNIIRFAVAYSVYIDWYESVEHLFCIDIIREREPGKWNDVNELSNIYTYTYDVVSYKLHFIFYCDTFYNRDYRYITQSVTLWVPVPDVLITFMRRCLPADLRWFYQYMRIVRYLYLWGLPQLVNAKSNCKTLKVAVKLSI